MIQMMMTAWTTVQVVWSDNYGNWLLKNSQPVKFSIISRKGEIVKWGQSNQYFDVITIVHSVTEKDCYTVAVLKARG